MKGSHFTYRLYNTSFPVLALIFGVGVAFALGLPLGANTGHLRHISRQVREKSGNIVYIWTVNILEVECGHVINQIRH